MNIKRILGVTVLLAIAGAAYAYPTLTGPTGIVAVPTADVVGMAGVRVAADYYAIADDDLGLDDTTPLRVQAGLLKIVEVGAAFWPVSLDDSDADTWALNAKVHSPIGFFGFDLAAGAQYAVTGIDTVTLPVQTGRAIALPIVGDDDIKTTQFYAVGTRSLIPIQGVNSISDVRASLGANWTQIDVGDETNSAVRAFTGVEVLLLNKLSVAAEYQTKDEDVGDDEPISSLVARYRVNDRLTVQAGYTNAGYNLGLAGSDDHNFFAGASLGFGAE